MTWSWTREDSEAANREGWDVFTTDKRDSPVQIQRIDDPQTWAEDRGVVIECTWEDDTDVWVFVSTNASPLHAKALNIIATENPQEWEDMKDWVRDHAVETEAYWGARGPDDNSY